MRSVTKISLAIFDFNNHFMMKVVIASCLVQYSQIFSSFLGSCKI